MVVSWWIAFFLRCGSLSEVHCDSQYRRTVLHDQGPSEYTHMKVTKVIDWQRRKRSKSDRNVCRRKMLGVNKYIRIYRDAGYTVA